MNKIIGITINGELISCQVDDSVSLITSDNISEYKSDWDPIQTGNITWNVDFIATDEQLSQLDGLKKSMKHNPSILAEFQVNDGLIFEREIKKYGSKMIRKILRDIRFSRPVVYYQEEFYCNF